MFKQLRIRNFKSLADTGDLAMKPLTILVGPNSSGKSALFKALLALKQTAESRDLQSPLVVNGDYVKLGSYEDFIYGHDLKRVFSIEAQLSSDGPFDDTMGTELNPSHETSKGPLPSFTDDVGFEVEFQYNRGTQQIQVKTVSATEETEHVLQVARKPMGGYEVKTPWSIGNAVLNKFYLLRRAELHPPEGPGDAQLKESTQEKYKLGL